MEMNRPSNRKFGLLFFGIFLGLAFYGLIKEGLALRFYFFTCLSLFFLVASIFDLKLLTSLNNVWFKVGIVLGKIVSPIVLSLIFFVLITPLGLFLKLFGRDVLKLSRENGKTYWSKPISEIDSESFKNQF
jgi:hypothetical protein